MENKVKLYTEKEVDKAMLLYLKGIPRMIILEQHITPIELPSDEDIYKEAYRNREIVFAYMAGAKFVIDKIQGGNK